MTNALCSVNEAMLYAERGE